MSVVILSIKFNPRCFKVDTRASKYSLKVLQNGFCEYSEQSSSNTGERVPRFTVVFGAWVQHMSWLPLWQGRGTDGGTVVSRMFIGYLPCLISTTSAYLGSQTSTPRTARCGPACRVVWGGGEKSAPLPDWTFVSFAFIVEIILSPYNLWATM